MIARRYERNNMSKIIMGGIVATKLQTSIFMNPNARMLFVTYRFLYLYRKKHHFCIYDFLLFLLIMFFIAFFLLLFSLVIFDK